MPTQPRLDSPGTLDHVMGRGIETSKIFRTPGAESGRFPRPEEGFVEPQWASWGFRRRPWPGSSG